VKNKHAKRRRYFFIAERFRVKGKDQRGRVKGIYSNSHIISEEGKMQ
jgi:hypothetical protein